MATQLEPFLTVHETSPVHKNPKNLKIAWKLVRPVNSGATPGIPIHLIWGRLRSLNLCLSSKVILIQKIPASFFKKTLLKDSEWMIRQNFSGFNWWKGSENVTPKYGALAYWLFWAEGNWETCRKGSLPFPFLPKSKKHKFPMRKVPSLCHSYHWRQGVDAEMNLYQQTLLNDPYLPLISPTYLPSNNLSTLKSPTPLFKWYISSQA